MKHFLLPLAVLGVSLSASAQSWSSINTTTALTTHTSSGSPIAYLSDYEIAPDAITTNGDSPYSKFPEGTVFSAYSLGRYGRSDYEPEGDGVWLLAYDRTDALQFSKKITVPNSVNVLNEDLEDGSWPDESLSYLTISSLQYDSGKNRELLIFTGSLRRPHSESYPKVEYEVMVVGSYDLKGDVVRIAYVDQPTYFGSGDNQYEGQIYSAGISVRETRHNVYMALGQTGNLSSFPSVNSADYPLAVVFNVDGFGAITILGTQSFEYKFKPIAAKKSAQDEMIAAGIHYNDQGYQLSGSGATTYLAPALFAFTANDNSGSWVIQMDRGVVSYMPEYSSDNQAWGHGYSYMDLFIESDKVYLGFSERLTPTSLHLELDRGTGDPVFGVYDVGLTSSTQFVKVQMKDPWGAELRGGVHRLIPRIGESSFEVLMVLDDVRDRWQRANNTSIGIIRMEKSGLDADAGHGIVSLWSADQSASPPATTLREVCHVTGLSYGSNFDYYMADGFNRTTSYARSHVFGVWNDKYDCDDFSENIRNDDIQVEDYYEDSFGLLANPSCEVHKIDQEKLDYDAAHCSVFDAVPVEKREMNSTDGMGDADFNVLKTGINRFRIEAGDARVKLVALVSVTGQILSADLTNYEVDLNGFASGVYLIHFEVNGRPQAERVVVE